ncbi:MAG: rRNA pseudouridine synthase [Ruminococcaceae bacterium]|nr:rRNA pseudouridine synthase [Oscillospiraceae bacterium]
MEEQMRLQKYIAQAGVASRRAAEQMIADGRVKVNGTIVTEMGVKVSPGDMVEVDGVRLSSAEKKYYIMLNKPVGFVTTVADDRERHTVMELVSDINARLVPVGRLDYGTEGLLFLSNDGDFTYRMTHPSHRIDKVYHALISGRLNRRELDKLCNGVEIDGRRTAPATAKILEAGANSQLVELTIHEGRNRQVRRMFAAVGHKVQHLRRVSVGGVTLGHLPLGKWRHLTEREIALLQK